MDESMLSPESTPARLRSKRKSSPRSIAHGSSDWKGSDSGGNGNGNFNSVILSGHNLLHGTGESYDSPGGGLHHRHRPRGDSADAGAFAIQRGVRSAPQALPQPPSSSKLASLKTRTPSQGKSYKFWMQCTFPLLLAGYFVSLYCYQNYYTDSDIYTNNEPLHHSERGQTITFNKHRRDSSYGIHNAHTQKVKSAFTTIHVPNTFSKYSPDYAHRAQHSSISEKSDFIPLAFNSKRQSRYEAPNNNISPAFQRAQQWSRMHIEHASQHTKTRREQRVERTSGGLVHNSNSINLINMENVGALKTRSGFLPLWYELNHSTKETMLSLRHRWKTNEFPTESSANNQDNYYEADFQLCGSHANNAAKRHPQNYFPSDSTTAFHSSHSPLGPHSRVLITGILSPLGMHLAIALSRQCNVTNFLGVDTQMPNDSLSRLEHQERLAVLMEELKDMKPLQVPFLGVESKQRGKRSARQEREGKAREEALMSIFVKGSAAKLMEEYTNVPTHYELPKRKFGIPLSPGTHHSGFGPLEILLEYRPTHVVHLAGTQSDSFLTAKDAGVSTFNNKVDEDEAILKYSISNKPHLYDLRMGSTGMEQILSAVVAQSMLPPRYGRDYGEDNEHEKRPRGISRGDLMKMKRPHLVYASSYDAHYFENLAARVNEKAGINSVTSDNEDRDGVDNERDEGKEDLGSALSTSLRLLGPPRGLKGVSSLIDEVLASTYYALHGVSSVGLRFDAIYGPRGFGVPSTSVPIYNVHRIRRGGVSSDVDLAETAVRRLYRKWVEVVKLEKEEGGGYEEAVETSNAVMQPSLVEEAGWLHAAHDPRDFVFVEDAVGAIIAAMQYIPVEHSPATFNIGSGDMSTLSSLSEEMEQLSSDGSVDFNAKNAVVKSVIDVEQSSAARTASLDSKEYLGWSSATSLQDGAARTLAWHLDRALPFFPPSTSADGPRPLDGEDILSRRGLSSCSHRDEPTCLREAHTSYPCASECSTKTCAPSVFDGVLELSREVTEDCETVLYTVSLGYDVKKLHLQTQYSDGQEQKKNNDPTICTIAFVPTESRLVESVIAKVPASAIEKMNLDLSEDSDYETKLKKLSGHLVHQGWILIFVDGATQSLTAEDIFMPKLSPRRLFHPSVKRAMFVDENFSSTPLPEDALFLSSEMSRGKLKKRTVMGPNERGKKIKYKLPEEPPRTAVLMVAPTRNLPKVDSHHMPLKEITLHLIREVGGSEDDPEPKEVRVQREFYEKARSHINSFELRSLDNVSRHRIEIKDFIRSRWILHDLKEEEGHQLRCEWYREHVRWNTHLDQLSFAYVMAKRELTRKVITEQPLQTEVEKVTLLQMVIDATSDAKEWHPIFSGEGTTLPIHHSQIAPEVIPQNLQDQHEVTEVSPDSAASDDGTNTFYVRIMSDERMMEARKAWMKARKDKLKVPKV